MQIQKQTQKSFALSAAIGALAIFGSLGCTVASSSNRANPPVQSATPATPVLSGKGTLERQSTGESKMDGRLVAANNEFGLDLFSELQREDKDKNIFCSPLSVATALAMTYNGAAGETQQAMARTLKLAGLNPAELNQANAALLNTLKSADPKIELLIANSLWARQGLQLKEDFLARNRQFFGAQVAALDFGGPQAVKTINNWVGQHTKGKIPAIIDQIDGQMVLFLINAIYFKGQWQKRFDSALTENQPFHLLRDKQKQVPLMSQSGSYLYFQGEGFQAVRLLYGQGGTSLCLFLPDQGSTLNELLNGLNYQKWEQWMSRFRHMPGDLKIPRFKLDYARELNDGLKALGMEVAFNAGKADFSRMREQRDLFISQVKHKAILEVNEEGTEAAAATSVGISRTSAIQNPQRFSFIADRPFLLAIRDQQTGALLFMGAVFEPL